MGSGNNPDKPMTAQRFFQTFLTVGASMVLVGGSLILLTSTSPFTSPPQAVSESSTPDAAQSARDTAGPIGIEYPRAAIASDQTRISPEVAPDIDRSYTASTETAPGPTEDVETASSDTPPVAEEDAVPDDETADASPEDVAAEGLAAADALPEPDSAVADAAAPAADNAAPPAPETAMVEDKTNAASDQIGGLLAGLPPRAIASDRSSTATGEVADLLAASPPAPVATKEDASPELAALTPAPPLPHRKPDEPQDQKVAAIPASPQEKSSKPAEPVSAPEEAVARRETTEPHSKSQWQPMALAPADKPVVLSVPTARPSSAAYAGKVWSALARHKPRAGQSGSATVTFAIGQNGALRGVKVGRSSGNARIDQLALATVRSAAPFPPPPSGVASYSIRIDFH